MLSYLCIAWNVRNTRAIDQVEGITTRLRHASSPWAMCHAWPGLRFFLPLSGPNRPPLIRFQNGRGVIVGSIFPLKQGSAFTTTAAQTLSAYTESQIVATDGRSIIKTHWGSYVAIFRGSPSSIVLRGPMSTLPCFWTETSDLTIFFSRPADITELGLTSFDINWEQIRAQSLRGDYLCEETALTGVYTLVSGDCILFQSGRPVRRTYWTPATAPSSPVTNLETAVDLIRTSTQSVISCWASLHDALAVSLSGGFDSSVVLSCLAGAPSKPRILAVNLYSRRSADERQYARSMAARHGIPLLEIEHPRAIDFTPFLQCARTANPVLNFGAYATEQMYLDLSRERGVSAIFRGELGDCVLGHGFGAELLADALWRYKLTARTLRVILNYAILYRVSVWRALRLTLREYGAYRRPRFRGTYQCLREAGITAEHSLVTGDSIAHYEANQQRFLHPWLVDRAQCPPGWLLTIPALIMTTSTWSHSGFSDAGDALFLSPLASQPLVEAFLAIPPDFHITSSESAVVARRAFGSQLSPEVLNRGMGKGAPDLWLSDLIAHNRPFLREILLDGILVQQGILDRRKIEAALSERINQSKIPIAELFVQLYIEAWLRRWTAGRDPRYRHRNVVQPGETTGLRYKA